jgi:hypothetical protein
MSKFTDMTPEQSFFAVFCVECLADKLNIPSNKAYEMLADDSDVLDTYIVRHYDVLHTQGEEYIVRELIDVLKNRGVSV